jgi:hypothetical protein
MSNGGAGGPQIAGVLAPRFELLFPPDADTVVESLHDAAGNGLPGQTQLSKSSLWDRGMRATFK